MIEALELIVRHAGESAQFYPAEETVVLDGVVRPDWEDLRSATRWKKGASSRPHRAPHQKSYPENQIAKMM